MPLRWQPTHWSPQRWTTVTASLLAYQKPTWTISCHELRCSSGVRSRQVWTHHPSSGMLGLAPGRAVPQVQNSLSDLQGSTWSCSILPEWIAGKIHTSQIPCLLRSESTMCPEHETKENRSWSFLISCPKPLQWHPPQSLAGTFLWMLQVETKDPSFYHCLWLK